jgi:tetratricopeptide (TPR) repeat protein
MENTAKNISLKSCILLHGLNPENGAVRWQHIVSDGWYVLSLVRQMGFLSRDSFSLTADRFMEIDHKGFYLRIILNEERHHLYFYLKRVDTILSFLTDLLEKINALLPPLKPGFLERIFLGNYERHFSLIHAGGKYYIGLAPSSKWLSPSYSFKALSHSSFSARNVKLIDASQVPTVEALSEMSGLKITHEIRDGGFYLKINGKETQSNLMETGTIKNTFDTINKWSEEKYFFVARPLPWNKVLVMYLPAEKREQLKPLSFFEEDQDEKCCIEENDEGIICIEKYLEQAPDDLDAWAQLGRCYGNMDEHEKCLKISERLLREHPENFELLSNKAMALVHLHKYQKALDTCHEAIELISGYDQIWYFLGVCLTQLGRIDEAISTLMYCTDEDPDYAFNWFALGYAYYMEKNYDKAIEHYKKAVETVDRLGKKDDAKKGALFNMACVYSLQNKIAESAKAFNAAYNMDPEHYAPSLDEDDELENLRNNVSREELFRREAK